MYVHMYTLSVSDERGSILLVVNARKMTCVTEAMAMIENVDSCES